MLGLRKGGNALIQSATRDLDCSPSLQSLAYRMVTSQPLCYSCQWSLVSIPGLLSLPLFVCSPCTAWPIAQATWCDELERMWALFAMDSEQTLNPLDPTNFHPISRFPPGFSKDVLKPIFHWLGFGVSLGRLGLTLGR